MIHSSEFLSNSRMYQLHAPHGIITSPRALQTQNKSAYIIKYINWFGLRSTDALRI
jgi:hypothetical protein